MKKHERILLWAGLVVATAALLMSIFDIERFDIDPQSLIGWAIAILAILVTVLIGWQIYTFIDINRKAKELSRLTIEASLGIERCLAISEDAASGIYYYLLLKDEPLGLEYKFLYHRISSLLHTSQFDDIETCNIITKVMLEMMVDPAKIDMVQSCKDRLLILLTKVKGTDKINGYSELMRRVAMINVVPRQNEA